MSTLKPAVLCFLSHRTGKYQGYSMIELMVVLLLILTVMTLLMPIFQSSKDTAKLAVCTSNMKQIYNGYAAESIGANGNLTFPATQGWQTAVEAIVESPDVMICPMDKGHGHIKSNESFEFLPEPPENVAPFGGLESDSKIFVFREKESFELPEDLNLISQPGFYGSKNKGAKINNFDLNGTLTAGTVIDVYYFHYDPVSEDNAASLTEINFGDQIMGFIARGLDLEATDELLGLSGVAYSPHFAMHHRGLDDINSKYGDAALLPEDFSYISYSKSYANPNNGGTDAMRVMTVEGGGTSYGLNVALPSHPSGQHIFLTDAKHHIIDFNGQLPDDDFEDVVDPRHFGKVNVLLSDGVVELMEPSKIQPESSLWHRN